MGFQLTENKITVYKHIYIGATQYISDTICITSRPADID